MNRRKNEGFTLVELLVVIGIIAILISILMPALGRAKESANSIKCAANLRQIGIGLMAYAADNKNGLPPAYLYKTMKLDTTANAETPTVPAAGYVHWSSYLMGSSVQPEAFQCPSIKNGGLPPTFPMPGGWDPGQQGESGNDGSAIDPRIAPVTATDGSGASVTYTPDLQAPRMAYTLNEGICGRNKFVAPFQGGEVRSYTFGSSLSLVKNQAGTILATEFIDNGRIVAGAGYSSATVVVKSHRPVSPWRDQGTAGGDASLDMAKVPLANKIRRTNATDFYLRTDNTQSIDPLADFDKGLYTVGTGGSYRTRLDWVGRNHGNKQFYADNNSNFLYCDGHVETKSVLMTVPVDDTKQTPWEWGDMNTLQPNNPLVP